jgi:ribosome-associated toxin RatA of RatAB toxin-antitoxin module
MREVMLRVVVPHHSPAETYRRISDFARYPEQTSAIRQVVVHPPDPDGSALSDWTVHFRTGLLRWTERDTFDADARVITFVQAAGDFVVFRGGWTVVADGAGARVTFDAEFDLGMPALAEILDPVAAGTLRDSILVILRGLLGAVEEEPVGSAA